MNIDLSGKVIVITGASGGIGKNLIRALAREHAKLVISYNSNEVEAKNIYEDAKKHCQCILVSADLTTQEGVNKLYKNTILQFANIDVLINNAGICSDNLIPMMTLKQWNDVLDLNLTSTFLCSRIFTKKMISQRAGKIINITSLKGQEGCEGQANYAVSKAGVICLTKTMAKELGRYNIAVNAVCPGFISTNLNVSNKNKEIIAKERNKLDYRYAMNDLISFLVLCCSSHMQGVSGQVFNLDSRL